MIRTAILVDGGFYRKRAHYIWGDVSAKTRADELQYYCLCHIRKPEAKEQHHLYRIFYYDCEPISQRSVFHPLKRQNVVLGKTDTYKWASEFLEQLKRKRKFALRLGHLSDQISYNLKPEVTKELCTRKRTIDSLTEADFMFNAPQKGVDMKIGVDIASLTYKKQVDQIVLISGDSDFVPAAKLARREGIDFVLDPMGQTVREDLFEHIDGLRSYWKSKPKTSEKNDITIDTTTEV